MIVYCTTSSDDELYQILELQKQNLPKELSVAEKEKEGFVTVHHTFSILKQMHNKVPHIIAKDNDKVVGYALCMHPDFKEAIDVLKPMFVEVERMKVANFIVMGQVCVSKYYRKQGIFRGLYTTMQNTLKGQFEVVVTEIDAKNIRSLQAHTAIGFKELCAYHFSGQDWRVVVLDV